VLEEDVSEGYETDEYEISGYEIDKYEIGEYELHGNKSKVNGIDKYEIDWGGWFMGHMAVLSKDLFCHKARVLPRT